MTVHVITDSSSCLPEDLAEAAGVTVVDLYTSGQGAEKTTAGLGALELTANYARLLERSGDEGVVALHLSKELSSTWSNAVTAAGVLEGKVRVVDTNTAGMTLGYAAIEAAKVAQAGGTLDEVADAADRVLNSATLWLYVHKIDSLRRGGRLSTGRTLLTTALAIKPILKLADGELQLAAKTRTQAKAMVKLAAMTRDVVHAEAEAAAAEGRKPRRMKIAIQQWEAVEPAKHLEQMMAEGLAELEEELKQQALGEPTKGPKAKNAKGAKNAKASKAAKEKSAKEKAGKDKTTRDKAARDKAARDAAVTNATHHGKAPGAEKRREDQASAAGAAAASTAHAEGAPAAQAPRGAEDGSRTTHHARAVAADGEQATADVTVHPLELPQVDIELFEISPSVAVHTGPGAIGVGVVCE